MYFLSQKEFNKLCPTYQAALIKLHNDLASIHDFEKEEKIFLDFTRKFTTLPQIWIHWINYLKIHFATSPAVLKQKKCLISAKALYHLFNIEILHEITDIPEYYNSKHKVWTRLLETQCADFRLSKDMKNKIFLIKAIEKKMFLPSHKLQFFYDTFDQYSHTPMTKEMEEKYQQTKELYEKITNVKNGEEKWLKLLKETNNWNLIIQNLEKLIGTKPFKKNFWLLYMSFAKEKNFYDIELSIYSRYCRFFIDDAEMRKEYQTEIEKIKELNIDVTKYQMDLVKILHDFVSKESAAALIKHYFNQMSEEMINQKLEEPFSLWDGANFSIAAFAIDFENYEKLREFPSVQFQLSFIQKIDIPESILYYILKNANSKLLQKLYSSSKQIYSIFKKPICHRLEIRDLDSTVSFQQSLYVSKTTLDFKTAKNLYLTNALDISPSNGCTTVLSAIIPNIYKCEVRYLTIQGQSISMDEFKFLASNVECFKMSDSMVGEKETVSIKDIIDQMPKVTKIQLSNISNNFFFPTTTVSKSEKEPRIKQCFYENIKEMIDLHLLLAFMKENGKQGSQFSFIIETKVSKIYHKNLQKLLRAQSRLGFSIMITVKTF